MSNDKANPYADIIDLPHHVSTRHPQMPMEKRAAQFSPFAAMVGHDAAIRETARLTEEQLELSEDEKTVINGKLQLIQEHIKEQPKITVTYFQPDEKKNGGAYVTITSSAILPLHSLAIAASFNRISIRSRRSMLCIYF